jgi:hypothetical protein
MELAPTKSNYTQETQSVSATVVNGITNEKDAATLSTADDLNASSSLLSFYFQIAVIVLGVIGTVSNGTTLCALVFAKQVMKFSFIFMV